MRSIIKVFVVYLFLTFMGITAFSLQQYSGIEFGSSYVDNSSPLIADIRPDVPGKEIAVGCLDGYLYVFSAQGQELFRYDAGVGIDSSPAAGDLDCDGFLEIVCGMGSLDTVNKRNYHGGIIVIDRFGNKVWGYQNTPIQPVGEFGDSDLPFVIPENIPYAVNDGYAEFMESTPALANVSDGPELEIFIGCLDFNFYGFNSDGTLLDNRIDDDGDGRINEDPGYVRTGSEGVDDDGDNYGPGTDDCYTIYQRQCIDEDPSDWPVDNQDTIFSSAGIGDIDNDGVMEIIFGGDSSQPTGGGSFCPDGGKLWFLKPGGNSDRNNAYPMPIGSTLLPEGNVLCRGQIFASSPALADVNDDGFLEIFIGTGNFPGYMDSEDTRKVFGFDYLGNDLPDWPYDCGEGQMTRSSPAIGDVNGDGRLDVVICSGDTVGTSSKIHAIDAQSGQALPGFPVVPFDQPYVISSPVIGDVNNDFLPDIVVGINNRVFAYDGFGNQIMHVQALAGLPFQNALAMDDVDEDGILEIVAVSANLDANNRRAGLYIIDTDVFNPETMQWPMFRGNPARTGLYSSVPYNYSEFVQDTLPQEMVSEQVTSVTVTVKNSGSEPWSEENLFRLGAVGDSDPFYSEGSRIQLPDGVIVNPGETYTFTISPFKAPSYSGNYISSWQMVQDGVCWFGEQLDKNIQVQSTAVSENSWSCYR